ncbi:MAG: tetratricopeptide repeat protein [Polyangiaceae bacterium]|nr:tetratricopeptide repeat protein [Polyangiaceae bacterium]
MIAGLSERLRADPADADAWLELGLAYAGIAHWAEAAAALARSVSFASERALGRLALGRALAELGRHEDAEKELEHAVRLAPDEPRAHKELGLARYRLGRHDEAAEALGRATHLAPADARAHFALGLVHEARRDMGAAIASYRAAVAAEPRFGAARKTLADALAQVGELAAAGDELRAVLRLERTNEEVALNLELCERALAAMQNERLLGKPEAATAASVLVTEGGFARHGVIALGPQEVARWTTKLAELWLTLGAAPAGAPPAARPVTRLLLVLSDPARAARRDDRFGVVAVSADGRRTPADYATGAAVTFLRVALGCPLTRASELYQALCADPRPRRWGDAELGFASVAHPDDPRERWHGLYVAAGDP